jgi:TatD family-associated radical SAM protein
MDWTYHYGDPTRLYLNVTNRCTNRCGFCVRNGARGLGDGLLWGGPEPGQDALLRSIETRHGSSPLREIVWCGFGEPTFRLDLITGAADALRARAGVIRLNTNGHACLIHGRDVLPELAAAVDEVSVSLNAPDAQRYAELCLPDPAALGFGSPGSGSLGPGSSGSTAASQPESPGRFWDATIDFLTRAPRHFRRVQATVVGAVLAAAEIDACRALARSVGVEAFRVR